MYHNFVLEITVQPHQDINVQNARWRDFFLFKKNQVWTFTTCQFLVTNDMKECNTFKMLVTPYQLTCSNIPEDFRIQKHCWMNLKP
jgi:hypothetical protein